VSGAFPAALTAADRWSPWSLVPRDGHLAKIPLIPKNKPWRSFEWAWDHSSDTRRRLGFQLGDSWCGVDLDKCRDAESGMVLPQAAVIVATFAGAYISPSVSGTGIHVIGRGPADLTGGEVIFREAQAPQVILHNSSWWFAMVPGAFGDPTRDITEPLLALRARSPKASSPAPRAAGHEERGFPRAKDMSDDELLTEILASGQGVLFAHLFRAEWRELGRYQSQSEADLALVKILAWWTNYDGARVDRLFRQSGLMRPKWNRGDYRVRTFAKAGC
jgi:putative DNA primase/helicase